MSKRKESLVWSYFYIHSEKENLATCNLCKKDVSRGKEGASKKNFSTHPLNKHLELYHQSEWQQVKKARSDIQAEKAQRDKEAEK